MFEPDGEPSNESLPKVQRVNPMLARFRAWHESAAPRASYQVLPRFWTPAGREHAQGMSEANRRADKSFEPTLTGIAWTSSRLYLVIAARAADYEHVAKLIHCRILVRDDPDHGEHHGKRVSALILCDDAPSAILDFARRHRVRVIAANSTSPTTTESDSPCDRHQNRHQL